MSWLRRERGETKPDAAEIRRQEEKRAIEQRALELEELPLEKILHAAAYAIAYAESDTGLLTRPASYARATALASFGILKHIAALSETPKE